MSLIFVYKKQHIINIRIKIIQHIKMQMKHENQRGKYLDLLLYSYIVD